MSISSLWMEFLNDGHCGMCGNTGIINTIGIATPAGYSCGVKAYCICPNGRCLKKQSKVGMKKWEGSSIIENK